MGRTKKESSPATTKKIDSKSKGIEKSKVRQTRERAQKSYREHSESDQSEPEVKPQEDVYSEEEASPSDSGSDWAGESSGSEYGKKKNKGKKPKAVVKKGKKAAASPKGRGRGRPSAKGKATAAARNGTNRKNAVKRYRDDSESESEGESSGSEYGKKKSPKKGFGAKSRSSPASARGNSRMGRPSKAASKSYKELSEEEEELSEEEKSPVAKKAKKDEDLSDEESNKSEGESSTSEKESSSKISKGRSGAKPKPASKPRAGASKSAATSAKSAKNGTDDEDDKIEEDDEDIKKKKIGSDIEASTESESGKGSCSEEDEPKKASKSLPAESSKGKKPSSKAKNDDDEEDDDNDISDEEKQVDKPALKNKTETDYGSINFDSKKKTQQGDDDWNFKIASWNIGGIKSWIKKNGMDYLKHEKPDVLCLQEIKCSEKTKPEELKSVDGYPHIYWEFAEQAGFHGVAILSKIEPKNVQHGLPIEDSDSEKDRSSKKEFNKEGRVLTAEFETFYLVNAYVPNAGRPVKDEKHPKGYPPKIVSGVRQDFDKFFREFVKSLDAKKPVIVTGDLNVSHREIDLANPKTNANSAGFTKEEREGMTLLLEEVKLVDSFRELYPEKIAYTFWSYMHNSRSKNIGWRLDYFLVSEELRDTLCESLMRDQILGSDHCPLVLFFKT